MPSTIYDFRVKGVSEEQLKTIAQGLGMNLVFRIQGKEGAGLRKTTRSFGVSTNTEKYKLKTLNSRYPKTNRICVHGQVALIDAIIKAYPECTVIIPIITVKGFVSILAS